MLVGSKDRDNREAPRVARALSVTRPGGGAPGHLSKDDAAPKKEMTIDLVLDAHAELGEGPIWDDERQRLMFVDIMRGVVHEFDPVSGSDRTYEVGEPVGAIALTRRGVYMLAVKSGFMTLDPATGITARAALVESDVPDNRMNDGYVDARGRFWAGTMNMYGRRHGSLYRLDPDGRVSRMIGGVTVSNGVDWSPDGTLMYYVDTATGRIDVFDFDEARGVISNHRVLVSVPHTAGHPDGLIVDADGFLWLALWAGGAIHRYAPDGSLDQAIPMPATHPTKCAFGGPDLADLYVTTAWIELRAEGRQAQPHAGGVYRLRPGARGRAPHRFGG
jgi:sugar lactone lactonase YvrE